MVYLLFWVMVGGNAETSDEVIATCLNFLGLGLNYDLKFDVLKLCIFFHSFLISLLCLGLCLFLGFWGVCAISK